MISLVTRAEKIRDLAHRGPIGPIGMRTKNSQSSSGSCTSPSAATGGPGIR
jgi:hypothetical protein